MKHIQDYFAPVIGEFEQLVLLALLRLGNGAYGAAIRREIQERTGRDLAVSAVYITLNRLEEKKMVVSYIGSPSQHRGGRRRRHYLINTEGEQALGRAYRAWRAMVDGFEEQMGNL